MTPLQSIWFVLGVVSVALGLIGAVLPLMPTVPFMILAAFCFARSSPKLEAKLLAHPVFGKSIRDWRERGAISRFGKTISIITLIGSAVIGHILLDDWYRWIPTIIAVLSGTFILTRPTA